MAQTAPDAEQVVTEFTELWNGREYERISDVVTESFVHVSPAVPDGEARGPDGEEAFMREVTSGFPDFEVTIVDMLSDGETVMVENSFTMTHDGEFAGIEPTGREVRISSMTNCRVVDGRLDELREYLDMQDVFRQLGVAEEPPAE